MRIGLYGMPAAGKSYILRKIDFLNVIEGSQLLREYDSKFDLKDDEGKKQDRQAIARLCAKQDNFIMDGHYAFGDQIVFTEEDGLMYDCIMYLYIDPEILKKRMRKSDKNQKYLKYDLAQWQKAEINGLRDYCHRADKDFYVIDSPENGFSSADADLVIEFIRDVVNGFSCINFAKRTIAQTNVPVGADVVLLDGDKTLIKEDSSKAIFGYCTHLYDGNFYTGYQSWKQAREFSDCTIKIPDVLPVHRNPKLPDRFPDNTYIVSAGSPKIWLALSGVFGIPAIVGSEILSDTKYFVTKLLQKNGCKVTAYGDGMGDYYMLKQADVGYLVTREDGSISHSLAGMDIGGLNIV